MPEGWEMAAALLPERLGRPPLLREAEEIRLRRGRPPTVCVCGREEVFSRRSIEGEDLELVLNRACRSSLHAVLPELRRGVLTAAGGVRIGVCGAVGAGGRLNPEELSSLCVRIPRQVPGAGAELMPWLRNCSVLILSPPGGGKTTFLRELIRSVSAAGVRVGVADERGELAALWKGQPGFDLGPCTDVLAALPKAEAALMLLRGMGEQVIAMDEIVEQEDLKALRQVSGCGVHVFATVHAVNAEDLRQKPGLRPLLDRGLFDRLVVIEGRAPRRYRMETL